MCCEFGRGKWGVGWCVVLVQQVRDVDFDCVGWVVVFVWYVVLVFVELYIGFVFGDVDCEQVEWIYVDVYGVVFVGDVQ